MTPEKPVPPSSGGPPSAGGEVEAWRRPVAALAGPEDPGAPLPDDLPLGDLTVGQRRIVAAVFRHIGCDATSAMVTVEEQRTRLRAGGLRRSDDIETLTVLVRLLIGRPLDDAAEVAAIHRAYHHLRQCHWWPSGPEDLPLAALLVADAAGEDEPVDRIEALHLALSEGDEVPGDPLTLVALCACTSPADDAQMLVRLRELRTGLLLSGLALQPADIEQPATLVIVPAEPSVAVRDYVSARRAGADPSALAIALTGDTVVLRHLDGAARQRFIASLVIRGWMEHRRRSPPTASWSARTRS